MNDLEKLTVDLAAAIDRHHEAAPSLDGEVAGVRAVVDEYVLGLRDRIASLEAALAHDGEPPALPLRVGTKAPNQTVYDANERMIATGTTPAYATWLVGQINHAEHPKEAPGDTIRAVAEKLHREFNADHLSWRDFIGQARELIAVASPHVRGWIAYEIETALVNPDDHADYANQTAREAARIARGETR